MSQKTKKKRNKKYQGADAAITRPTVTRITAANRSKIAQWWFEKKRIARPILIGVGVVTILVWLGFEIARIAAQ